VERILAQENEGQGGRCSHVDITVSIRAAAEYKESVFPNYSDPFINLTNLDVFVLSLIYEIVVQQVNSDGEYVECI
jgi:hypothetical protein